MNNRTVLITGVSRGIGRAIALRLLEDGHQIIGIARNPTASGIASQNFQGIALDLQQLAVLPQAFKAIEADFPRIDTLIACAGRGDFGSLEEFSYARIDRLIALNFTSQVYLARSFIPHLKRRKHGDLIFIGSEAALQGKRKGSLYCAAKFALRGLAQALREECAGSRVRVSIIHPGMVASNFFDDLNFAPGEREENAILPEDVAELVVCLLRLRNTTVVDEIVVNPLSKAIRFKKPAADDAQE